MIVKVKRYNPELDKESYYKTYDIPITKEERFTVMDVLDYIVLHKDSSLSYFKHSACNHGICGRCALKVNEKVKLACTYLVQEDDIVLEPRNGEIIKDLVVR